MKSTCMSSRGIQVSEHEQKQLRRSIVNAGIIHVCEYLHVRYGMFMRKKPRLYTQIYIHMYMYMHVYTYMYKNVYCMMNLTLYFYIVHPYLMLVYSKSISPIGLPNQLFLVSYMYMYVHVYVHVAIQGWGVLRSQTQLPCPDQTRHSYFE